MSTHALGKLFTLTTFGESHGPTMGCIVSGCPANFSLNEADIQCELNRRKPGVSHYTSQRRETDQVKILSGIYEGKTTGTPLALLIENTQARSRDYETIKDKFRPGHADYTYFQKYGIRDPQGGGRASARETVNWVAAGAIAKKYLREQGITIRGYLAQLGNIQCDFIDAENIDNNPFFCADPTKIPLLEQYINDLRKAGDSIGARVIVEASNVPVGLGEPIFNKLSAAIAHAMMTINAVKGIEIGDGFKSVTQKGSEHRDEITPNGFLSNHSGGILGGISTGQNIVVNIAFKPASSIRIPAKTIDIHGNPCEIVTTGRHDPCVGIRGVPVAEAMLALVLMDFWLLARAYR